MERRTSGRISMTMVVAFCSAGSVACATTTRQRVMTPTESVSVPQPDPDEPPRLLHQTQPRYPPEAFYRGIQGTVELEILIDATGRVSRTRILKSIPALDVAAVECVNAWRFKPAEIGGTPVASVALAPVTFTITDKKK
jgi:TonB family protein